MSELGCQEAEEPAYSLHMFPALANLISAVPSNVWATTVTLPAIKCLVSTAVSFAALTNDGTVLSWGSALHPHLLARHPTKDAPAETPHPVSFLQGLHIRKIAAGGWIYAAISQSDDLYMWGGQPGNDTDESISCLPNWSEGEGAKLVDVDGGIDVLDVAVGDGHVVALTEKGEVWVTGRGYEGQLGMGSEYLGFKQGWTRTGGWGDRQVLGVGAGSLNSFVMVRKEQR